MPVTIDTTPCPKLAAGGIGPSFRVLAFLQGKELFGHEKGHIEVYQSLLRQGHEVLVCLPHQSRDSLLTERLETLGIRYQFVTLGYRWSWAFVKRHLWLPFYNAWCVIWCSLQLRPIVMKFQPTHVLLGSETVYSYVWPTVWIQQLTLVYRMGDRPSPGWFAGGLWKTCVRGATGIVAISKYIQRLACEAYPPAEDKVLVIYNCSPERPILVKSHDSYKKTVLYVGQISRHKGVQDLIDVAEMLTTSGRTDIEFHFVGGSEFTLEYEQFLRDDVKRRRLEQCVRFHGPQRSVQPFYEAAELHVAPTITTEALGNVVLEAKSCGVPSVVYPTGGLPEMIRHQIDGYVCPARTVQCLAEGILWCLESESRRTALAERAYEDAQDRFGQEQFDQAWSRVLEATSQKPVHSRLARRHETGVPPKA